MFVDRVTIEVHAGKGGDGCASFRREKYVPRGGPDGGDGGRGGDVILVAKPGVDSLNALAHRKFWKAENGGNGQGANKHGRNGEGIEIFVPPGTIIMDDKLGFVMRDLKEEGEQMIAARGGHGGRGNVHFKSATNRAPRQFGRGGEGEVRNLRLELKVIADVGLIGKPNAGKSTMLSRLSSARPQIADYPFTTKHPNLGRVQVSFDRSFVMADIPGLIEGAHSGIGLGHEFLRHVQRAGVLVHLVEPDPVDGTDPIRNYETIRDELALYDPELARRPEIIVVSKSELPGAAELAEKLSAISTHPVLIASAVTGEGLNRVVQTIARVLDEESQAKRSVSHSTREA
jgi:GTPase